ncbi:MAG: ABC transporter substrate-binding protein [Oscillospiraceae bacterium]|nr:ABC transporter substrate-binding protein [Oscillospiraceae bacterium]
MHLMKRILATFLAVCLLLGLTACGGTGQESSQKPAEETAAASSSVDSKAPVIQGLTYEATVDLTYAECFQIFRYEGGYSVIRVDDGRDYLLIPEGGRVPGGLPSAVILLHKPLGSIYVAATASMALFDAVGGLNSVGMSSLTADSWYVENAARAMEEGSIVYAGKYSAPDYELLVKQSCDLAVESTMIWHSPDILEKIQELKIPVLIDRASYEPQPLGRMEWVKLYGELLDKQEEAEAFFEEQESYVTALAGEENSGKTVVVFYVSSTDTVIVRKSDDYIAKMIDLAGGKYLFTDLVSKDGGAGAAVDMTMEEFYASAVSADYILYNASISDPVTNLEDLFAKSELFRNFKAVQEGHVWCTERSLYQATDAIGTIISDLNCMLGDENADTLNFIYKLN